MSRNERIHRQIDETGEVDELGFGAGKSRWSGEILDDLGCQSASDEQLEETASHERSSLRRASFFAATNIFTWACRQNGVVFVLEMVGEWEMHPGHFPCVAQTLGAIGLWERPTKVSDYKRLPIEWR